MNISDILHKIVRAGFDYRERTEITKTEHAERMRMKKHHLDKVEEYDENIKFQVLHKYATFHGITFEVK